MMIFAEADPLNGWLQIMLQGGALGLLAYIVAVIAPRAMEDSRKERVQRDELFRAMLDALESRFGDRSSKLVIALEENGKTLSQAMSQQTESLRNAMGAVCRASRAP